MDETLHQPKIAHDRSEAPPLWLWFGVLGAPAAWALQGLFGWLAASVICERRNDAGSIWLSMSGLRSIELGICAFAILIAAGALAAGFGAWRDASRRQDDPAPYDFLATIAVFGSLIFLLGILWAGVPALLLAPCEHVR